MSTTCAMDQRSSKPATAFTDSVAVVTGAGSGIGRALALELADAGALLALNDRSREAVAETAKQIEDRGGTAFYRAFDVGSWEEMQAFADAVRAHYGRVDVVINNAGVALGHMNVDEVAIENFRWIVDVNVWGVFHGTMAFLPLLRERPEARLVNVSSAWGLLAVPGAAPYCATKFAVRGFTDSLRLELMDTNVCVTLVCPSQVKTNIVHNGRHKNEAARASLTRAFDKNMTNISAAEAARRILDGVARKQRRVLIGRDARIFDLASRFLPDFILRFVTRRELKKLEREMAAAECV